MRVIYTIILTNNLYCQIIGGVKKSKLNKAMCTISRHKSKMLSLYKMLITESKKFPAYNFRMYALRRVRDQFRENQDLKEPEQIEKQIKIAQEALQVIRRQAIIGHLYGCDKIAIEK